MTSLLLISLRGFCLSCALPGLFSVSLAAQDARTSEIAAEWRLLYATDSVGHATRGEKAALIRAVRSGQPIRVGWKVPWRLADGTGGILEHAASASFLTIHHDEVFGQLAPILGQAPVAREPRVTLRTANPQLWYGLVSTTGELRGYFMGGDSATTVRVATEWYARTVGSAVP
jgi:hypothetical protein